MTTTTTTLFLIILLLFRLFLQTISAVAAVVANSNSYCQATEGGGEAGGGTCRNNNSNKIHYSDGSCSWGTYRSYPYIGLRAKNSPNSSPLFGLMWHHPEHLHNQVRHEATDNLQKFGYQQHDGHNYGTQYIQDLQNQIQLQITWIQNDKDGSDATWTLRIHGEALLLAIDENDNHTSSSGVGGTSELSLLWYMARTGNDTVTYEPPAADDTAENGSGSRIIGQYEDSSSQEATTRRNFALSFQDDPINNAPIYPDAQNRAIYYNDTYFYAITVPEPYNPKPYYISELQSSTSVLPPKLGNDNDQYRAATCYTGNQIVVQRFYTTPFTIDLNYIEYPPSLQDDSHTTTTSTMDETTHAIQRHRTNFEMKFYDTFIIKPPQKTQQHQPKNDGDKNASTTDNDNEDWSHQQIETAHYALGNLLSQITYMYGDRQLLVDGRVETDNPPAEMLVSVPDRPSHAQGFMWDEGFHQFLICRWDRDLSMEIVSSWFSQVNDDTGWLSRQQILGDESRWSAEPTSWAQIPDTANPPSLYLFLEHFITMYDTIQEKVTYVLFLDSIYEKIKKNVEWFVRTQASPLVGDKNLFRWRGRTATYTLPSGMDDYPRAPVLTDQEAHLDAQAWAIVSTRCLAKVAGMLDKSDDEKYYLKLSKTYQTALRQRFWDTDRGIFDEFYMDEEGQRRFVGHVGYLNFFPIFLDVVQSDSKFFASSIRTLLDEEHGIWTPYGLRSLSSKDPYFKLGDNYWTSPIWMNINFLACSFFYRVIHKPAEYPMETRLRQEIEAAYQDLRRNLIDVVVDNYQRTGFIWEVYDGDTGKGLYNHPFTGWSALVVNIMSELY